MLFFHCPGTSDSRPPVFHPLCRCNDILFYVSIFFLARHTFAGYRLPILHVRFFTPRTPAGSVQAPQWCLSLSCHPSLCAEFSTLFILSSAWLNTPMSNWYKDWTNLSIILSFILPFVLYSLIQPLWGVGFIMSEWSQFRVGSQCVTKTGKVSVSIPYTWSIFKRHFGWFWLNNLMVIQWDFMGYTLW